MGYWIKTLAEEIAAEILNWDSFNEKKVAGFIEDYLRENLEKTIEWKQHKIAK